MTFILPKKTRFLWQLRIAVAFFIVFLIVLFIIPLNIWTVVFETIIFCIGFVLVFIYVPIFIKNYKIVVDNQSLCIYKGVFIKSLTILPHVRLVFVKNLATPLMSFAKLQVTMLKVAKGWIFIPEMDNLAAKRLLCLIGGEKNDKQLL